MQWGWSILPLFLFVALSRVSAGSQGEQAEGWVEEALIRSAAGKRRESRWFRGSGVEGGKIHRGAFVGSWERGCQAGGVGSAGGQGGGGQGQKGAFSLRRVGFGPGVTPPRVGRAGGTLPASLRGCGFLEASSSHWRWGHYRRGSLAGRDWRNGMWCRDCNPGRGGSLVARRLCEGGACWAEGAQWLCREEDY